MAPNAKVGSGPSIRSASKSKQRSTAGSSGKKAIDPFGSSTGGSLASSLSSLFTPKPHGKDAALASLLASSSKPPVQLGGLQPFGSLSQPTVVKKLTSTPLAAKALPSTSQDQAPPPAPKNLATEPMQTAKAQAAAKLSETIVPHVPAGRKAVFRPVLASSTMVSWPDMPAAGSQTVLHTLLELLATPELKQTIRKDFGRVGKGGASDEAATLPCVLAGINSITRRLEEDIACTIAAHTDKIQASNRSAVRIVFVCRQDGTPASMLAHFPMLTCAYNAVHATAADKLILFPLPANSEALLAKAVGLRRCTALALTLLFPPDLLSVLLAAINRETGTQCQLQADWLNTAVKAAVSAQQTQRLAMTPTTIKFLRTTQPTDLNLCKTIKKDRRKLRASRWKSRKFQFQQQIKRIRKELKSKKVRTNSQPTPDTHGS